MAFLAFFDSFIIVHYSQNKVMEQQVVEKIKN